MIAAGTGSAPMVVTALMLVVIATLLIGDQFRETDVTARAALVDGVTRLFARMLAERPAF